MFSNYSSKIHWTENKTLQCRVKWIQTKIDMHMWWKASVRYLRHHKVGFIEYQHWNGGTCSGSVGRETGRLMQLTSSRTREISLETSHPTNCQSCGFFLMLAVISGLLQWMLHHATGCQDVSYPAGAMAQPCSPSQSQWVSDIMIHVETSLSLSSPGIESSQWTVSQVAGQLTSQEPTPSPPPGKLLPRTGKTEQSCCTKTWSTLLLLRVPTEWSATKMVTNLEKYLLLFCLSAR